MLAAFGSPVQHDDGTIGLDRDKAIEAIDWFAGLLTRDHVVPPSAANDGFRQVIEGFQTGQTAMIWHHTGSFQDIASKLKPGVEFGTLAMPAGPATRIARLGYAYNCLTKRQERRCFAGNGSSSGASPMRPSRCSRRPATCRPPRQQPRTSASSATRLYAPAVETLGFGTPQANFAGYAGWSESTVLPNFQRVLIGEATPEEAVDEMIAGLAAAIG